jgi:hypothetical protein
MSRKRGKKKKNRATRVISGSRVVSIPHHPPTPIHREPAGTGPYTQQIISCLERIAHITKQRPYVIFANWIAWIEAAMALLPEHLHTLAACDFRAGDPTRAVQLLYSLVRTSYPPSGYVDRVNDIWANYLQAFNVLLESARPGLWTYDNANGGYMGPDVVADTYLAYSRQDPEWEVYDLMSFADLVAGAQVVIIDGEGQVMEKLKAALDDPRNLGGKGLLENHPPAERPDEVAQWLFFQVIPAAMPYYEPITLMDAWAGTGARILAMASLYPGWAVTRDMVHFVATEPDPLCAKMASINCYLYGINGWYMRLYEAVNSAGPIPETRDVAALYSLAANAFRLDNCRPPQPPVISASTASSFEALFRHHPVRPSRTAFG